jgi:serine/threonine-protein kinase
MTALMEGIATQGRSLQSGTANEDYRRLQKRIVALRAVGLPLPEWFIAADDGWAFWKTVSGAGRTTYQSRRDFIRDEFVRPLEAVSLGVQSLEQALLGRDLVLEEKLGQGGFGQVYRAHHLGLQAPRAVKVFDPHFYNGEEEPLRRFAREADILSRVNHPGVVRFFDAGIVGSTPFIITDLVKGADLQAILNDTLDAGLPVEEVAAICDQVLAALACAHALGVVHRDVKPSNVIWHRGTATLLDFGAGNALARSLTTRLTTQAIGTAGFIAPELYDEPGLLDPRTDLYSVGALAHSLLTKRTANLTAPAYYLDQRGVPSGLRAWVVRAFLPPTERFPSAETMRDGLKQAMGN